MAREARAEVARAVRTRDHSAAEVWKARLADLGVRVAGALVEMDDLAGAAEHLATLDPRSEGQDGKGDGRLAMSRALMWLHLGDVEAAKRCIREGRADETGQKVVDALADMADGEYEAALQKWKALRTEMEESGVRDEMVGVNLAVCLLYVGRMEEVRRDFFLMLFPEVGTRSTELTIILGTGSSRGPCRRWPCLPYTAIQPNDYVRVDYGQG